MNRRLFVATAATGAVGAVAGCIGDILDDVTTFEATPIRASADAEDDSGYEYQGTEERVEEREYEGQSVEATNYVTQYTRTIDLPLDGLGEEPEAGVLALVSTPRITVAGESFNPVDEMSDEDLVDYVQEEYEELEVGDNVGGRAIEAEEIESTVRLETWNGTATLQGQAEVDVFVDVAQLDHDDDHLVVIGVYPDEDDVSMDDEREELDTLIAGIEHGDDVDVDIVEESESDGDGEDE